MSTGRTMWIIWCCACATGWLFFTWWTVIIPLIMVPLSLAAIMLPVGKPPRPRITETQWHELPPGPDEPR